MWHPFDIMPQELTVSDTVRNFSVSGPCRLTYGERVTRWFKDKSSADQQWPPTVDRKPGLTLTRRPAGEGTLDLEILHTWILTNTQTMSGRMTCRTDGWRSPLSWEFRQTFVTDKNKPFLSGVIESGSWKNGLLERVTRGAAGEVRKSTQAAQLASTYALMADFPEPSEASGTTGLLQEALSFSSDVALVPVPALLQENPLAHGLRGFSLQGGNGYPADYWVNSAGTVIYVCYGPNRAFVLDKAEALS